MCISLIHMLAHMCVSLMHHCSKYVFRGKAKVSVVLVDSTFEPEKMAILFTSQKCIF